MKVRELSGILLGLAALAFLITGCVDSGKLKQMQDDITMLNQNVHQKDVKIKTLTDQGQLKQKELDDVKKQLDIAKKELGDVKLELDTVKKELEAARQPIAAPVAPAVPAAPAAPVAPAAEPAK